jgi:hypothetical protein
LNAKAPATSSPATAHIASSAIHFFFGHFFAPMAYFFNFFNFFAQWRFSSLSWLQLFQKIDWREEEEVEEMG